VRDFNEPDGVILMPSTIQFGVPAEDAALLERDQGYAVFNPDR
jgi:hypothetical protein